MFAQKPSLSGDGTDIVICPLKAQRSLAAAAGLQTLVLFYQIVKRYHFAVLYVGISFSQNPLKS